MAEFPPGADVLAWVGGQALVQSQGAGDTRTCPPLSSLDWVTQSGCHMGRLCCQARECLVTRLLVGCLALAVQARLYGLQIEELEEEGR